MRRYIGVLLGLLLTAGAASAQTIDASSLRQERSAPDGATPPAAATLVQQLDPRLLQDLRHLQVLAYVSTLHAEAIVNERRQAAIAYQQALLREQAEATAAEQQQRLEELEQTVVEMQEQADLAAEEADLAAEEAAWLAEEQAAADQAAADQAAADQAAADQAATDQAATEIPPP